MLEESNVRYGASVCGSSSKIVQQQHHGSRNDQGETQKEPLDRKSHLQTFRGSITSA